MSAGIDPGCIRLRLGVTAGRVTEVSVVSERPAITRLLRGRAPDEAQRLVPLLFALCGKAQGRAAALALESARGKETAAYLDPLIQQEALREHLWRWLLDLPLLLGEQPLRDQFVTGTGWIASGQRGLLAEMLGGSEIQQLRKRLLSAGEAEDIAEALPPLLPSLDAETSLATWPQLDAGFCLAPQWKGAAAETGAIARQSQRGTQEQRAFAARWLARLQELQEWANAVEKVGAGGTASAVAVAPRRGRALVETARGLLMHEIVLDGDRIGDYFIVAPTEWNFHPRGSLLTWLLGRNATDGAALRSFVGRAVAALDPCVRWEISGL